MNNWLLLPTMIASLLVAAPSSAWRTFRCRDGGFVVSMPSPPRAEVKMLRTEDGPNPMYRFTSYSPGCPIACVVVYQKLTQVARKFPLDALLDGGAKAAARDINSRLVGCHRRSIQGFPGREMAATNEQGLCYHACSCVANGRLYQIIVCGAGNQAFSADAARFLKSFRILTKA